MHELVELIVDKYDGSLKAEHGTGINMAPFVEREWGAKATELMWRVKQLADPDGILGAGVVLNRDPGVHLRNLKSTPEIEDVATKCIECGFCEPVCPSRNVTTTPRQRIALRREMARQPAGSPVLRALLRAVRVRRDRRPARPTARATHACPVGDRHRQAGQGAARSSSTPAPSSRRAGRARRGRRAMRAGYGAARRRGSGWPRAGASRSAGTRSEPGWPMPGRPVQLPPTAREGAPPSTCRRASTGSSATPRGAPARPDGARGAGGGLRAGRPAAVDSRRRRRPLLRRPWSSKGYATATQVMAARTADGAAALERRRRAAGGDRRELVHARADHRASRSTASRCSTRSPGSTTTCSTRLEVDRQLPTRRRPSDLRVPAPRVWPASWPRSPRRWPTRSWSPPPRGCCGMAGDRGWLHPELPASALRDVAGELAGEPFDACVSSNRTCEIALAAGDRAALRVVRAGAGGADAT